MSSSAAGSAPADHEIRKQAIAWYARLCSGDASDADHTAWREWLQQRPDHQRAWQRIEAIRSTVQRVPGPLAASTLRAAEPDRRRALRGLAGLAIAAPLGYVAWQAAVGRQDWSSWLADYRTKVGEQRDVELVDGSLMSLNTGTAADVAFDPERRLIRLRDGELMIETATHRRPRAGAPIDSRPFWVETAQGRIRALGTRFAVHSEAGRTRVTVLEEAVEIHPAHVGGAPLVLHAGQHVSFSSTGAGQPEAADPGAGEWRNGSLVVDDWRLADVLAELSRYRRGHLGCDETVANIRISGALPVKDVDKALTAIARSFPVRISSLTRYWVTLVPR